ncbi:hypothetical protein [Aquabacterium sp. J223]|uniref:hypothetical protein n=1 Tax=Aquabacterium sp. J223 TaxID=2898431 RepID=UPI0021AD90DC|nr:hypothetical protein [Aquabacterium sp. J223]UUX96206.1 hypothetical protein LRS07_02410 [Aquabacterium sp. J223]
MANEVTWAAEPPGMTGGSAATAPSVDEEGWGLGCEAAHPALLGLIDAAAGEPPVLLPAS